MVADGNAGDGDPDTGEIGATFTTAHLMVAISGRAAPSLAESGLVARALVAATQEFTPPPRKLRGVSSDKGPVGGIGGFVATTCSTTGPSPGAVAAQTDAGASNSPLRLRPCRRRPDRLGSFRPCPRSADGDIRRAGGF